MELSEVNTGVGRICKVRTVSFICSALMVFAMFVSCVKQEVDRPNVLFAISDDQSFIHTGYAGCDFINTPAFDRIAKEGIYFTNCYAGSPGCAPSRSTIVTGRFHWQNEQSGQHASSWLKKYKPFVDVLETNGYHVGMTGKGVAPFKYAESKNDSLFRYGDAAGPKYNMIKYQEGSNNDERFAYGISNINYAANFKEFLKSRNEKQPFFFWYGGEEPHRVFEQNSWEKNKKQLEDVNVPGFLPDNEIVRKDMLDYAVEIDWFDLHLKRMIEYLDEIGELDNTIVIVTSDNGMSFPRAKANGYEYGTHVPLAIRYPKFSKGNKVVTTPVSFVDFAPTILELANCEPEGMQAITGHSMKSLLESENPDKLRMKDSVFVFAGRERHSSSRYKNMGYPQRVIRSKEYLLIWNMKPDRWPAGAPQRIKPGTVNETFPLYGIDFQGKHHPDWAFTDIDASPSKSFIVENYNDKNVSPYFNLAISKRPEFELFNIVDDPFCLEDLIDSPSHTKVKEKLKKALLAKLKETGDPRIVGPNFEVFDSYKRFMEIRDFPKPENN